MACKLHVSNPAANTIATVSIAPQSANQRVKIAFVHCSYRGGTPAADSLLTITNIDGGTYTVALTAAGSIARDFNDPLQGDVGATVVVSLSAAGASLTGTLAVGEHQ